MNTSIMNTSIMNTSIMNTSKLLIGGIKHGYKQIKIQP